MDAGPLDTNGALTSVELQAWAVNSGYRLTNREFETILWLSRICKRAVDEYENGTADSPLGIKVDPDSIQSGIEQTLAFLSEQMDG